MAKQFKDLKNREIRVKVTEDLFNRINAKRGLIKQNTYLAALIVKALDEEIKVF